MIAWDFWGLQFMAALLRSFCSFTLERHRADHQQRAYSKEKTFGNYACQWIEIRRLTIDCRLPVVHRHVKGQETNMGNKQDAKYETSSKVLVRNLFRLRSSQGKFVA